MEIELKRDDEEQNRTFGCIYVMGAKACESLEDAVREVDGQPVESWKINGRTAIPRGRYRITIEHSPHFNKDLPRLHEVPGFQGVLIHSGNTEKDTEGCILVGQERNEAGIVNSRAALVELQQDIQDALSAGEQVWLTVS